MNNKVYYYILPLLALIPIFIFRDYTPDNELRYISIIEEALNNGSVFAFYNQGIAYADKPPLYFWLLMACRQLTGENILLLIGLFTQIPCGVIFYVMNKLSFGRGAKVEMTPMLMLLTSVMFIGSAVVIRMDMLMVMFIVLALYNFFRLYSGTASKADRYFLPLNIFFALFSKGPVGILVPVVSIATFLAFEGQLKSFGKYLAWREWAIILGLAAVWFGGVALEGGSDYIHNLLYKQTVGRSINSFHHKEPFYYYLQTIWYAIAPWSVFCVVVIAKSFKQRIIQTNKLLKFYSVVIISTFVMMSLISSKIDIYLLPIYPFLIYLAVLCVRLIRVDWMVKATIVLPALLFAVSPVSFFFMNDFLPVIPSSIWLIYLGVSLLSLGGIVAIIDTLKSNIDRACKTIAISLLVTIFTVSFTIPSFNDVIGLGNLATKAEAIAKENNIRSYAFYQFRSGENMDVYLQTKLEAVETVEALGKLKNTLLFVRQREISRQEQLRDFLKDKVPTAVVGDYKIYLL